MWVCYTLAATDWQAGKKEGRIKLNTYLELGVLKADTSGASTALYVAVFVCVCV